MPRYNSAAFGFGKAGLIGTRFGGRRRRKQNVAENALIEIVRLAFDVGDSFADIGDIGGCHRGNAVAHCPHCVFERFETPVDGIEIGFVGAGGCFKSGNSVFKVWHVSLSSVDIGGSTSHGSAIPN